MYYRIGSGSFSYVFKAVSAAPRNNGVRSTVAIKVMSMQAANSSKLSSDCVVSEIKILKNLKHKNIVRLHDFHWDHNNIYLIMEYCGSDNLSSFIKRYGSLPEALTRRFFRQIAVAIQYMRTMNVAHMDLKPQNILLTNRHSPFVKISDFGLALYLKKNEHACSFRGSPLYMAPEIFRRCPYDSRVDLWSCGVILYECLYGIPPFRADTYDELVEQILSKQPIHFLKNIHLSHDCLDLLKGLLVRDPFHRITFERFFTHPFVNIAKLTTVAELREADSYVQQSRQAELEDNLVAAIKLLTNAIQIYMCWLESLEENKEKAEFRKKIKAHLEHAENMKEHLRPVTKQLPSSHLFDDHSEWKDKPQVYAAELLARAANDLEYEEQWSDAFEKYTLAIEGALQVLRSEDRSTKRAIKLQHEVSNWLFAAERLKVCLYLQFLIIQELIFICWK
ncbi:unnamed protein product [Thelazia callipaeda]|uniref:non-specific serine/threonine protein kinase n=1 Tax=Thelazia callipaeda TaxID=103827 RepID=A0A0N5CWP6_THECL|nr:unnamed protein product [Thelazia callipaeda]